MNFKYIMLITAIIIAITSAGFSIFGLSQLFAGASTAVIIMASILELGKIVTTTALHTYWDKLAKGLRIYLTISVGVLMIITSVGIYGFLSNAYQKTANKLEIHEGELGVLNGKKIVFEKSLADNQKIIDGKTKRLDQLSNLRTNQESRLDGSTSNRARNSVRSDIASANSEIQKLTLDIDELNVKNSVLSDSISSYNVKGLEKKANNAIAGEVGPLKYISELTGVPMSNVVNYMILLLIFVFDPLAVALILITNKVFILETGHVIEEETKVVKNKKVTEKKWLDCLKNILKKTATKKDSTKDILETLVEKLKGEGVNEGVNEEIEIKTVKKEPIAVKGKIELEDIKEIKEGNRGFSVKVPEPKTTNMVERIGSNKIVKDGDNNKVIFRRD